MAEDDEFDLSPLLSLGANSPFPIDSEEGDIVMPEVTPRPISKRRGKKRSSRACTTCRARKVRCNIVAHGAPCSNCRHDEIDCVLPLSRRQRSARERAEQSLRNSVMGSEAGGYRNDSVDIEQCHSSHPHEEAESNYQDRQWERVESQNLGPHGMNMSEHVLSEILSLEDLSPPRTQPALTTSRTKSWIQIQSPLASAPAPHIPLPRVFTSFPRHLDAADIAYLTSRDALTLPPEPAQIELLKAYIEFIHPIMPILDLEEFLSAVKYGHANHDGQQGRGIEREIASKKQIPLLLFQAVMFAGVGVVSMKVLKEAGYASRESAERIFFSRARLCYDFDTATDRHSIIQSLLLMTLSSSPPSHDGKDAWHWLGLAISLSFSLGLNRGPSQPQSSLRKRQLERRIWWTAFIRDRTLALCASVNTMRPVRIRREDCDIDMLSVEDFDIGIDKDGESEDMKTRQQAREVVEKAMLAWCSNDVLLTRFSTLHPQLPLSTAQPQQISIPQTSFETCRQQGETAHPTFSHQEPTYHIAASVSSSLHSDCPTPHAPSPPATQPHPEMIIRPSSPLGGGFGVDGEYDDYFEYLKPEPNTSKHISSLLPTPFMIQEKEKGKGRETWAFQLDCENGRVVEV